MFYRATIYFHLALNAPTRLTPSMEEASQGLAQAHLSPHKIGSGSGLLAENYSVSQNQMQRM